MENTKKKLQFEDKWLEGMENEDGLALMECLTNEPDLLTVTYQGCNVLHLSIRHDWYGLVEQILRLFEHLYQDQDATKGPSPLKPKVPGSDPGNKLGSGKVLGVEVLRNLLLAKEGDGYTGTDAVYSSGLDCLGMAVIRCNMAVNTILARAIQKIPKLFPQDHLYKNVVTVLVREGKEEEVAETKVEVADTEEEVPKTGSKEPKTLLCDIMAKCFPHLTEWLKPNMSFRDCKAKLTEGSQAHTDDPMLSTPLLLPEEVRKWILRAPYIPLAEYLLIEYVNDTSNEDGESSGDDEDDNPPEDIDEKSGDDGETSGDDDNPMEDTDGKSGDDDNPMEGTDEKSGDNDNPMEDTDEKSGDDGEVLGDDEQSNEVLQDDDEQSGEDEGYPGVLIAWLHDVLESSVNIEVIRYILRISDARRSLFHYVVLKIADLEYPGDSKNPLMRIVDVDDDSPLGKELMQKGYFGDCDAAGRSSVHYLLALYEVPDFGGWNLAFDYDEVYWNPLECGTWEHEGWAARIDLESVHKVNGYTFFSKPADFKVDLDPDFVPDYSDSEDPSLSALHIILTSPHLTSSQKRDGIESLLGLDTGNSEIYTRYYPRPSVCGDVIKDEWVSALQLATLMGHSGLVDLLAKDDRFHDNARIKNQFKDYYMEMGGGKSALHFAAQEADPEILRMMIETDKFDVNYDDYDGNTVLHSAAFSYSTTSKTIMLLDFVELPRKRPEGLWQHHPEGYLRERKRHTESRRQGCVNLLLQEGLDMWDPNDSNKLADPGPDASPEYSLWWYEKLTHETLEQKSSFSAAATAISVTAALIATASYVGPLQPPLGYSLEDEHDQISKVQAGNLSVRVFLICDTLAFYLALAGIMLSLTPSLPMPNESTRAELRRIRRSVTAALLLLTVSIVLIFAAFGSASLVIVPHEKNYKWLTGSTLIAGGILCITVWFFCCIRAVRLIFRKNDSVRQFYTRWVYI